MRCLIKLETVDWSGNGDGEEAGIIDVECGGFGRKIAWRVWSEWW